VTTVGQQLVIEGKHEEKSDEHGQIERHFVRKVLLPKDVHADKVVSHLTSEGVLTVSVPKLALNAPQSRTVPIQAAPAQKNPSLEQKKDSAVAQKKEGS
jgi:crystallin alpha B